MSGEPIVIDVDTGVDDAIALALAIARKANVIGVTTVAGNVPIDLATRNTLDVLAILGREDIPVHRGASRPLVASYRSATDVHGLNGIGGIALPPSDAPEQALPGPAFILQSAQRHAGNLVLVALGPLTNLAIALNVRPGIVNQISRVVVMGGAYAVRGNVTPDAEFNIWIDPDAAKQVFAAKWPSLTLVGLDVTHQTVLSSDTWQRIPPDANGAAGLVHRVTARTFTERKMSGLYLHDPLAFAVALDPTLVEGNPSDLTVHVDEVHRGKTVALGSGSGPLVATSVDAERFVHEFSDALGLPAGNQAAGLENPE